MKLCHREIIYENKKWRVTAFKHTNGTYSGRVTGKMGDSSFLWIRYNNNYKDIYVMPDEIPRYITDRIKKFVRDDNFTTNIAHVIEQVNKVEKQSAIV